MFSISDVDDLIDKIHYL